MIGAEKHISGERIVLIHSNDYTSHRAYYFLHIDALHLPLFHRAVENGECRDIEDFGEIITSGYGDAPQEIKDVISRKYGWHPAE